VLSAPWLIWTAWLATEPEIAACGLADTLVFSANAAVGVQQIIARRYLKYLL